MARTLNVYQLTMSHSANACQDTEVKLLMLSLDADHCQFRARYQAIVQLTHTVTVVLVSRPVFWIKSAVWMKFA